MPARNRERTGHVYPQQKSGLLDFRRELSAGTARRFLKKAPQRLLIARVRVSTRLAACCVDRSWNRLPVTAGNQLCFSAAEIRLAGFPTRTKSLCGAFFRKRPVPLVPQPLRP